MMPYHHQNNVREGSGALRIYFDDISRHPLLTNDEERELAERVLTMGDKHARQKLILSNLRLVVKVALNYYRAYLNLPDLIQEGNIGLIRATEKYDPHKGRFSTYAFLWIRTYILRYVVKTLRMVKVGATDNQMKVFFGLGKAKRYLASMGEDPNAETLARTLDVTEEDIRIMESRLSSPDMPLDLFDDIQGCLDTADRDDNIEEIVTVKERSDMLQETISLFRQKIDDRDTFILENRIMSDNPLTMEEIGKRFGISRQRVQQLETTLRKRLKTNLTQGVLIRRSRSRD